MSSNISESMIIRQGPALRVIMEITNGPFNGRKTWLRAGQILRIGRTERADFTVPHDKNMSSLHFTLECGQDVCKVRDEQSANGITVNGEKVAESLLKHGDEIGAGSTKFRINIEGSREVPTDVAGRTIQLSGTELNLPKHFGPPASKLPPTFRMRTCMTGLALLEGSAAEPAPAQVAQTLTKLGSLYLLVDFNRMALAPPAELTAPEYLYDWIPASLAADQSPVLLSASDAVDPFPILASGWGLNGIVTLISSWEKSKLVDHLRGVIRGKTRADGPTPRNSMVGICWPDILGSMLRDSMPGSRDYLFSAFDAVLLEGAEPPQWQIFCKPGTVPTLQKFGFVRVMEDDPTKTVTSVAPPA